MSESHLAKQLGLKYPILQAPVGSMGGVELAAAVSNAGGLGSLALTFSPSADAGQLVRELRKRTSNPFFVNFVLAFPPASLDAALEAGVPVVTFAWGHPGPLIERVHRYNALVGVQVGTLEGAKSARKSGVDFIICQGIEAGGHVQSTTPITRLLADVIQGCRDIPVVAAGGLGDGEDIARVLEAGADAVMLGTRFLATVESRAHKLYKKALVDAKREDAILTLCFNGGWPHAAHRVLRNSTLQAWEDAGCPPVGSRPGEGDKISSGPSGKAVFRYDSKPPASDMEGDVLSCCLYAGLGCDKIDSIPTVDELISKLWSESLKARNSTLPVV